MRVLGFFMPCCAKAFLPMERQKQHSERIKRRDEYRRHHREIRVAMAGDLR